MLCPLAFARGTLQLAMFAKVDSLGQHLPGGITALPSFFQAGGGIDAT
nr:hypothetical protein RSP673_06990 [Ralstonia solanacearum P673]